MPHGGLGGPWSNPALIQKRAEGGSQGVKVERAAPVVNLGDAGSLQVPVEDAKQTRRNREHWRLAGQTGRNRLAKGRGFALAVLQQVGEPLSQIVGQIAP